MPIKLANVLAFSVSDTILKQMLAMYTKQSVRNVQFRTVKRPGKNSEEMEVIVKFFAGEAVITERELSKILSETIVKLLVKSKVEGIKRIKGAVAMEVDFTLETDNDTIM